MKDCRPRSEMEGKECVAYFGGRALEHEETKEQEAKGPMPG